MDHISPNNEFADGAFQSEPDYDHIKEIARGGFGVVYLFRRKKRMDEPGEEYCAGKFIYAHLFRTDNDDGIAAYQRAFNGLQNFQSLTGRSDDLLKILHVRQRHDEGYFCYMMELADDIATGREIKPASYQPRTLKRELAPDGVRRRIPAMESVEIAISLARGLQMLHENEFIHRDVRPSNIIFVNGVAKLADIDLLAGNDATLTSYIPREYAAPEASHTKRADIFSFGKTLYEMCMGLPLAAFPRLPPDVRDWEDHKIVLQINKVIAKACAHDLRKRYSSAKHLLDDLEHIRQGKLPIAKPPVAKVGIAVAATVIALIVILAATSHWPFRKAVSAHFNPNSPISLVKVTVPSTRAPMPRAQAVSQAREQVQKGSPPPAMGSHPSERSHYALSLLNGYNQDDPLPNILAHLELARDIAAEAGDQEIALRACDLIEGAFAISVREINAMKAAALAASGRVADSTQKHKEIVEASVALGFRCLAMDDFQTAKALAQTASLSSEHIPGQLWANQSEFLTHQTQCGEAPYERVHSFSDRLQTDPEDAKANLECGKYLCFIKNTWDRGLPMLAKSSDRKLKEVAQKELERPFSSTNRRALGDAWWELANAATKLERGWFFERATYWYGKALSDDTDSIAQNQMKQRREQFFSEFPPTPYSLVIRMNVEGGAGFVITSDELQLNNSHGVRDVSINLITWGDFRRGGPEIMKNYGETRFMPDGLDFTRATISKRSISKGWAKVSKFDVSPDRIVMKLVDPPAGSADFLVVISF